MLELTAAPDLPSAGRLFFERGDVVGIKVNPVGGPLVISCPEVLPEIVRGLESAGVRRNDIVVYDRYRDQFLRMGFEKWLPEGVRWSWAAGDYDSVQQEIEGYDPDHYMDMAVHRPDRRSCGSIARSTSPPIPWRSTIFAGMILKSSGPRSA